MVRDDAWIGGVGGDGELESVDRGDEGVEGVEDGTEERGDDGVSDSMMKNEVVAVELSEAGTKCGSARGLKGG
jgi:hypothetical protein